MSETMQKPRDHIREELENDAPLLSAIERKPAFETPEDYFEYLPQQIQQRVLETNPQRLWGPLWVSRSFKLALGFSFALMFILSSLLWFTRTEVAPIWSLNEDELFDQFFALVSEYHTADFYDLVLDDEAYLQIDSDTELDDYLFEYADYYMIDPFETEDPIEHEL